LTGEDTGFLYPFLDAAETDEDGLLADLAVSARSKMAESEALATSTVEQGAVALAAAAAAVAACFEVGGRLFCFGNGGSATDAAAAARLFLCPPHGVARPAVDLAGDSATITALANDVGFELVFARQLMAHGRAGDAALAFSTSGNSANLLAAMGAARRLGMTTVAVCGTGGGRLAASDDVDHCLVVASQSVHRIQEAQRSLLLELWRRVQDRLESDV
jgi:D-sedoheptulose 7-phosphate isomerase